VIAISTMVYAAWTLANPPINTVMSAGVATGVDLVPSRSSSWPLSPRNTAFIGAILFLSSDALIGWTRFVRSIRWAPVAIMATYHLAQVFLVLALLR
jgi:hypothetical protein